MEATDVYWRWKTWRIFLTQAVLVTVLVVFVFFTLVAWFGPTDERKRLEQIDHVVDRRIKEMQLPDALKNIQSKITDLSVRAERSEDERSRMRQDNKQIKAKLDKVAEEVK